MPLQSSGAISLNDVQTEFGGVNPIGINEYYAGGLYVQAGGGAITTKTFSVASGNKAPLYGSGGGAFPPSGWSGLQNGNQDDAFIQIPLPFTFYINNTGYTTVFIGSNSYLTFGSGSIQYTSVSASNPAIPKLMFGAADNSYQRVSSLVDGTNSVSIRYEGNNSTGGVIGSPGIVVELMLVNPSKLSGLNVIEMLVGNWTANSAQNVSNVSNASTAYATFTMSANTSYVFTGNSTGTSWTVSSGFRVNTSSVVTGGVPASGTISLFDFYGKSGVPSSILVNTIEALATYMRGFLSEYKNPSFYEYNLDGDATYINDGGNDMYDGGNYTSPWVLNGITYTSNQSNLGSYPAAISYANIVKTTVDTDFSYASVSNYLQGGTTRPLMVIGTRASLGSPVGWQKGGNSGADGAGVGASGFIYNGSTVNGFTVSAFSRQTYAATDPSHCDLYILLGHPTWGSVFGTINAFADPVANGGNGGYLYTSGVQVKNILAIALLLSKAGGAQVTTADLTTVTDNIINRVKLYYGY